MSKNFGKFLLLGSLIAGAAAGSYAYLRKEGLIDESASPAKALADRVSSDAAERLAKERTYLDLGELGTRNDDDRDILFDDEAENKASEDTAEELQTKTEETAKAVQDKPEEAVETVQDKVVDTAETVKDKTEEVVEAVQDKAEAAVEATQEKASEAAETIQEKIDDIKKDVTEDDEEGSSFEAGIRAEKVNAAERKTIGSTITENFFNDEE